MIKHIIMFQLTEPTPANLGHLSEILMELPSKIEVIRHMETGVDLLRTERSMDLVLISHFDSLDDLSHYSTHPEHLKVVAWVRANCKLIKAVDFEV